MSSLHATYASFEARGRAMYAHLAASRDMLCPELDINAWWASRSCDELQRLDVLADYRAFCANRTHEGFRKQARGKQAVIIARQRVIAE